MKLARFAWCLTLLFGANTCFAQYNPVSYISQPLVPGAVAPGGPEFTLTVNGAGFVPGSIVNWNRNTLVTTFVSASKLRAVVPAAFVSSNGTARVTVVSSLPGGGSSEPVLFAVTGPTSSLVFRAMPVEGIGSPISAVTSDFNKDGIADLAVIDQAPAPSCNYQWFGVGSVAVFLGNGDGTFSKDSTLCFPDYLASTPRRFALTADLNRDGNVDLIAVSYSLAAFDGIYVFSGNGDGTFISPLVPAGTMHPLDGLTFGDFYSNGQLNIVMSNVNEFIALPELVFLPEYNVLLVRHPSSWSGPLIAGDFDGDGILDLTYFGMIFLNRGNGTFTQMPGNPSPDSPIRGFSFRQASMVSGDFNGDGILDLVDIEGNSVSVLLGKGDGTFSEKTEQPVSAQNNVSLFTTDSNGDGKLDLIGVDSTNTVSIWLGNGDGTFQAPFDTTGRGDSVVAADFNGDGRMDLAVTDSATGKVSILLQGSPYKAFVESPIDADGTSVFSTKRGVLPVKITLTENGVPTCNMPPASIALTRTASGKLGPVDQTIFATSADKGSNFRIDRSACQYVYNLATRSLGVGAYRADFGIDGIVVGHAVFALQ
jgi:hypothetical protein